MHKKVIHAAKKVVHHIKKIFGGFTIIELIVVIAIISVLAAIVLVNLTGYINKGKDAAMKADIAQLATSLKTYQAENGNFTSYTLLDSAIPQCGDETYSLNKTASQFVLYHQLCSSTKYWCTDATGAIAELDNAPDEGVYTCVSGVGGQQQGGESPSYAKVVTAPYGGGPFGPEGNYVEDGMFGGYMSYAKVGGGWYIYVFDILNFYTIGTVKQQAPGAYYKLNYLPNPTQVDGDYFINSMGPPSLHVASPE